MLNKTVTTLLAFLIISSCQTPPNTNQSEYLTSEITGKKIYKKNIVSSRKLTFEEVKIFRDIRKQSKDLNKNFSIKSSYYAYPTNCYDVHCDDYYDCYVTYGHEDECGNCSIWEPIECGIKNDSQTYCTTQYDYSVDGNKPKPSLNCTTCQSGEHIVVENRWNYHCEENNNNSPYITDSEYYPHGKNTNYNSYKFSIKSDVCR